MNEDPKIIPSGPFKGMKFECAPTSGVDMFQTIAEDFLKRILDLDSKECLITDESSVYDFVDFAEAELRTRVRDVYSLDISEIESGNLLKIFRRIQKRERQE